ncbi:hypothetical protein BH23CHL1_BH23CHL1_10760 [soil metagenome]
MEWISHGTWDIEQIHSTSLRFAQDDTPHGVACRCAIAPLREQRIYSITFGVAALPMRIASNTSDRIALAVGFGPAP